MSRRNHLLSLRSILVICFIAMAACSPSASETIRGNAETHPEDDFLVEPQGLSAVDLGEGDKLRIVTTTNIIADVVSNVGGNAVEIEPLIPLGADLHTYEPTPSDIRAISDADVVFINGGNLESFFFPIFTQVSDDVPIISLSEGIDWLHFGEGFDHQHEGGGGQEEDASEDRELGGYDPHVWFDPTNIMVWVDRAFLALRALDPINADLYEINARKYTSELEALDQWIQEQVNRIPPGNRELVTDHLVFSYLSRRYGLETVGAVIPAFSTAAAPSARDIAALEEMILDLDVRAVFVGKAVNPKLVEQVAEDTGVALVFLYTNSLSEPGGPAASYLDFMRFNILAIIEALQ